MLIPAKDLKFMQEADHNTQKEQLAAKTTEMYRSTKVGKKIFKNSMAEVVLSKAKALWIQHIEPLKEQLAPISKRQVKALRTTLTAELDALADQDALPALRCIKVFYRGWEVDATVTSLYREMELRLNSVLKSIAVDTGSLIGILGECRIKVPDDDGAGEDEEPFVETAITAGWKQVREAVNFTAHGVVRTSGQYAVTLFQSRDMKEFTGIDSTIIVEAAWFGLVVTERGDLVFEDRVLGCFGSEQHHLTLEETAAHLQELVDTRFFQEFAVQNLKKLEQAQEIVNELRQGISPQVDELRQVGFMSEIVERLPWSVCYTSDEDEDEDEIRGVEAIRKIYRKAERNHEWQLYSATDIKTLQAFDYLFSSTEREVLKEWDRSMKESCQEIVTVELPSSSGQQAVAAKAAVFARGADRPTQPKSKKAREREQKKQQLTAAVDSFY